MQLFFIPQVMSKKGTVKVLRYGKLYLIENKMMKQTTTIKNENKMIKQI